MTDDFGSVGTIDDLREILADWLDWYNGDKPGLAPILRTKAALEGHVEVTS